MMRTHGSFNHPGPMKSRPRSCYKREPTRLRLGAIRRSGGPAWAATRAGPFLTERANIAGRANTRLGRAAVARPNTLPLGLRLPRNVIPAKRAGLRPASESRKPVINPVHAFHCRLLLLGPGLH